MFDQITSGPKEGPLYTFASQRDTLFYFQSSKWDLLQQLALQNFEANAFILLLKSMLNSGAYYL